MIEMEPYQLIPAEGTRWHFEPNQLAEQMPVAWPQADIIIEQSFDWPGYQLYWNITFDPERDYTADSPLLSGWLADDLQCVLLHGDFEPAVEFAVWFQMLFSGDQPIIIQDESKTYRAEIDAHTGKRAIMCVFAPDLTPLEWQVLNVLNKLGGIEVAQIIFEEVQIQLKPAQLDAFVWEVDHALTTLWQVGCISSPSMKWVPQRSASISNIVTNDYWSRMRIGLTSIGTRALLARSAANNR